MPGLTPLKRFPFHFLLVILFFLLHGYSEYIGLIPFTDLLIFFLAASAAGFIVFFILKKIVRSAQKAGIITSLIFLFYLFYGSIKDTLKPGWLHPLSRYSILLPVMLVLVLALGYYFRKTSRQFPRLTLFINVLLLIYILVDLGTIIAGSSRPSNQQRPAQTAFTRCDTCATPDIHLILLDEYAGLRTLQRYFNYDNQHFKDSLQQQGFYVVPAPSANYSATPVAVASLFSMEYLPEFHREIKAEDYTRAEKMVNQSIVLQLLKAHGYTFLNHSIFNLDGQPGRFRTDLLPMRLKLITDKTLWNSIVDDLGWQINKKMAPRFSWLGKMIQDDYKDGNQRLLNLTRETIVTKTAQPRFVYTHLLMPHWPYLLDSTGRPTGINFFSNNLPLQQKEAAYVQYLAYTNKVMLELTAGILRQSGGNAVIILMSDHGYRARPGKSVCEQVNDNFISVYLPGGDYRALYGTISNVNIFRAVFNSVLKQRFVRLPDHCIY
ncbi:MAG TPA: sulfatase-like hydrolase/transferase [Chitinophagaceae bacterium]|nr:sulfatase-like hydrolase/transferase [Chitinophagaceae bacterium]